MFDVLFSEHTLTTALSLATPILLCALGGAVCSQSGNFNISMEAFMLIGAFSAWWEATTSAAPLPAF